MTTLTDKRRYLKDVTTLAIATTIEITNLLQNRTVPEIASQLRLTLPAVTRQFAQVAAVVSSTQYNQARTSAKLATSFAATPKTKDTDFAIQAAVGFSIGQLDRNADYSTFQSTLAGSVQRLALTGDRETVDFNVLADPDGVTYERVPSPTACAFCLTMAAVAEVQRSSNFDGYHNFCNCALSPIFAGQDRTELPIYKQVNDAYSLAGAELERQREEVGWYSMKTREAAKLYPNLTQTTKNKLKLVRQITGWK